MVMILGEYKIMMHRVDSKSEMNQCLEKCKEGYIKLIEPECHSEYIFITFQHHNKKELFGMGVYSTHLYFLPAIIIGHNENELIIVHNEYITSFNMIEKNILYNFKMDTIIFHAKHYKDKLVVISELNVVLLNRDGNISNMHVLDDVLESFEFRQDLLICQTSSNIVSIEI